MIVTQLNGGLGNQMFQYAIAKKLALKFSTDVVLDAAVFETDKLRKYSLTQFNFQQRLITSDERAVFGLAEGKGVLKLYYKIIKRIVQPVVLHEKQFNFDPDVFRSAKKYTYLYGYWQTEKYFSDIRDILIHDFTLIQPLVNENIALARHIIHVNSVSLHIRRGDYVTDLKTAKVHGVCSLDYYHKGIEYIFQKTQNLTIFLFSDDIGWAKENFKTQHEVIFVDSNSTPHEDLRLMSLCKHNIIANSSFSWWGAWLNKNLNKVVIAPIRWFADEKANQETNTLIPETWVRI